MNRTRVNRGTAFDIAGKIIANELSLKEAINIVPETVSK
ncbi:4-hydroxythreonine-4-phosphate dehydrogenase PdxA [Bacillus timonensis]